MVHVTGISLRQLCPAPRAACGPVEGFVWPNLGFRYNTSSLHTDNRPYFDNPEFDIFYAGGPQCHFITSVSCDGIVKGARNQLGTLGGGEEFSERSPNFSNYIQ